MDRSRRNWSIGRSLCAPVGSSNHDPPFAEILSALSAGVRAAGKQRTWILGDTNARVGELPNRVRGVRIPRTSDDRVINQRGRDLMSQLNEAGMWLINGSAHRASTTYEGYNGASCIDLVWSSENKLLTDGCTECRCGMFFQRPRYGIYKYGLER